MTAPAAPVYLDLATPVQFTVWEYRSLDLSRSSYGDDVAERLSALGREGWEVCGVIRVSTVLLKRPLRIVERKEAT